MEDLRASPEPIPVVESRRIHFPVPLRTLNELFSDNRGAAIVEFAIVSMPFFLILFAIFQTGLLFFEQQILQTAVSDASRLVLTGQAQTSGLTQAQFKQQVCAGLPAFMPCSSVAVDIRPQASFASAQIAQPVGSDGKYDPTKVQYSIGAQKDVIVVSAFSVQPILFPMMSSYLGTAGNGNALVSASAAFRNEPWKK